MKKMKIMTTVLAGVMTLGMTACGTKPTETTATPTELSVVESTTEATTSETTEATTVETTAETSAPAQQFSPEQHGDVICQGVEASEFNFGPATFDTYEWEGVTYADYPNYEAGKDIVVTFKCDTDLTIEYVAKVVEGGDIRQKDNPDNDEATTITSDTTLTQADGVYTLTISANRVTANNVYYVVLKDANDNRVSFEVRCWA